MAFKLAEKTVTAAGTAEAIFASKTIAAGFTIRAKIGNTGNVFIGDSTVDSASTGKGAMEPGAAINFTSDYALANKPIDMSLIYVDSAVNGEGVDIWYNEIYPSS